MLLIKQESFDKSGIQSFMPGHVFERIVFDPLCQRWLFKYSEFVKKKIKLEIILDLFQL